MTDSLHLGLTPWLAPIGRRADELSRQAESAEQWGYESFWLPENHFGEGAIPEPMMLLSAVAGATQTIRLGTTSYLLPLRHPLQAAEQVAVLDQLSNGRVILGVGRGYQPALFDAFNVVRAEKREIFADCLATMRRAWGGEAIGGDANVSVWPRPVQTAAPADLGRRVRTESVASGRHARLAVSGIADGVVRRAGSQLCAARRSVSSRPSVPIPNVVPIMRTVFVSQDAAMLDRVREALATQVATMRAQATDAMRTRMPETVDEWGIVGTPPQVLARIAEYRRSLGMTHLIATRLRIGGIETAALEESIHTLAEIVGEGGER